MAPAVSTIASDVSSDTGPTDVDELRHVLREVLSITSGSTLELALKEHEFDSIDTVISLSSSDLQKLYHTTRDDQNKLVSRYVPRGVTVKLETLALMGQHYAQQGNPIDDWTQMTSNDFKAFQKERIRGNVKSYVTTQSSAPPAASTNTPSHASNPVQNYVKGIKRDATQFPTLKP